VSNPGQRTSGAGGSAFEQARRRLITSRFPRFAAIWLLLAGGWRVVLVIEGRVAGTAALLWFAGIGALLLIADRICRSDPAARHVRPIAFGACLLLGASSALLEVETGGSPEILAFMLFTLALLAAISFGWGWRTETLLLLAFLAMWATVAPFLVSFLQPIEVATELAVGALASAVTAELYARSFAHSWRQRRRKRHALRALAASYQDYRDLAENAPALIYTHDLAGRLTYVNEAAARHAGIPVADLIGRSVFALVSPEPDNAHLRAVARRIIAGERVPPQLIKVGPAEAPRVLECIVAGIPDTASGRIIGIRGIALDVTARVQAERAQAERRRVDAFSAEVATTLAGNDPLETTLQHCAAAIVRHLDAALARIWLADDQERTLTLTASAGLYTNLDGRHSRIPFGMLKIGLIAQERVPHLTNAVIGDPRVHDQEWAKRTGMVAFAGYPILLGEHVLGVVGLFARHPLGSEVLAGLAALSNVLALGIDRKRSEAGLRDSVEELRRRELDLHRLAERQATIREEERKRISFDLHEDVCQDLVGVGIMIESLRQQIAPLRPETAAQFVRAGECLAAVVEHMRLLAHDLRPMILRDLGLEEGLRSLVRGMESSHTTLRFVCPIPLPPLDEDIEIGIYRIAQEALANAHRHAHAREIVVTLTAADSTLQLEVRDDGRGFVGAERTRSGGLGLLSIEERALALGGRLTVSSAPDAGTTVGLECPLISRTPATAA